ncbi:hypothetical protein [Phytoactinopolyspora mesophila]|uniref:PE-PGRS family protein n=1 Tax=Phytoactinopolyspora mesophila TaxID=2650750 RepID=A0A7K3MCL1_9ACTN|nr:hypothetical protein [Phytoactinopolyspora mesophila]NDL61055.1 hypothetical protein [Phytoactinopolyspora mesophila]
MPTGFQLVYTGRSRGDLIIRLFESGSRDETDWNRIRLNVRRVTIDPELVAAALEKDFFPNWHVSEAVSPRAVNVVLALRDEARRRGHRIGVNTKTKPPQLFLQAGSVRRTVSLDEERDQVPHVLTDAERRALRRNPWPRPREFDYVPSGRLRLRISRARRNDPDTWVDGKRSPLEKQVRQIINAFETGLAADEQARLQAEREAEEQHARWKREKEEERARWEAAMAEARIQATEKLRQDTFRNAYVSWIAAQEIQALCTALETTASGLTIEEHANLTRWITWARTTADQIDPSRGPTTLAAVNFDIDPGPDDLRPFLGEWSPHRPERDYYRTGVNSTRQDHGTPPRPWHHGMRGKPSWWRNAG